MLLGRTGRAFLARSQTLLYVNGGTVAISCILLCLALAIVVYSQMLERRDISLNAFLASILVQMIPLVWLKAKLWRCRDTVGVVPSVLEKTLMMHGILLVIRLSSGMVPSPLPRANVDLMVDLGTLCAVLFVLRTGFDFPNSLTPLETHRDVWNLVLAALIFAVALEAFFVYVLPRWTDFAYISDTMLFSNMLLAASNYVDVLTFVPALWRLHCVENDLEVAVAGVGVPLEVRRQVWLFLTFVASFYLWDDVVHPYMSTLGEPLVLMAHGIHFVLLIDFAAFFAFEVTRSQHDSKDGDDDLFGDGDEDKQISRHSGVVLEDDLADLCTRTPMLPRFTD